MVWAEYGFALLVLLIVALILGINFLQVIALRFIIIVGFLGAVFRNIYKIKQFLFQVPLTYDTLCLWLNGEVSKKLSPLNKDFGTLGTGVKLPDISSKNVGIFWNLLVLYYQ